MLCSLQSNSAILGRLAANPQLNQYSLLEMREYLGVLDISSEALDGLNVIHIAGTKGKGSVCAFIEHILRKWGVKTAMFTSPHLISPRERIRVAGLDISEAEFTAQFYKVHDKIIESLGCSRLPTYFRMLTLMAFDYFLSKKIDVLILETGIGGRYDVTNVVERPIVCGITSLGYDHLNVLGKTISEIASHKAGIIKANRPVFTMEQPYEAMSILKEYAEDMAAPLKYPRALQDIISPNLPPKLGIPGIHQTANAAMALELCIEWAHTTKKCTPNVVAAIKGLEDTRWQGRCQTLDCGNTRYFLDGAHTVESMILAMNWFKSCLKEYPYPCDLVFHCTADRQHEKLLAPIYGIHQDRPFRKTYFCPPTMADDRIPHDTSQAEGLAAYWETITSQQAIVVPDIGKTIQIEASTAGSQAVLVTGSLHLVGAALSYITQSSTIENNR